MHIWKNCMSGNLHEELITWLCSLMVKLGAHFPMQHTMSALELEIFKKKLENSYQTKTSWQIYIEYKHKILEYFCVEFIDFMLKGIPMDTSLSIPHRFDVEISRGKLSKLRRKGVSTWKLWIDSTWKFRRGFDFKNWRNISELSTCIFLCRFNAEST